MPDDADTIRARIGQENAAAVEAKIAGWIGNETEMAAYDADAVMELGRKVV